MVVFLFTPSYRFHQRHRRRRFSHHNAHCKEASSAIAAHAEIHLLVGTHHNAEFKEWELLTNNCEKQNEPKESHQTALSVCSP
jgi:hypothetical protein